MIRSTHENWRRDVKDCVNLPGSMWAMIIALGILVALSLTACGVYGDNSIHNGVYYQEGYKQCTPSQEGILAGIKGLSSFFQHKPNLRVEYYNDEAVTKMCGAVSCYDFTRNTIYMRCSGPPSESCQGILHEGLHVGFIETEGDGDFTHTRKSLFGIGLEDPSQAYVFKWCRENTEL